MEKNGSLSIGNFVLEFSSKLEGFVFNFSINQNSVFPMSLITYSCFYIAIPSIAMGFSFFEFSLVHAVFGDESSLFIRNDSIFIGDEGYSIVDHFLVDDAYVVSLLVVDEVPVAMQFPIFRLLIAYIFFEQLLSKILKCCFQFRFHSFKDYIKFNLEYFLI